MSGVVGLVEKVRTAGGTILPDGRGGLKVRAPRPLPESLVAELRRHKAELMAALLARREGEALAAQRVYQYRLSDNPDQWLTMLCRPGDGLREVTESLRARFGADRVLEARPYRPQGGRR